MVRVLGNKGKKEGGERVTQRMSVFEMKFEEMNGLYIPEKQKARVLERYGKLTISELDRLFDINTKIGGQGSFGYGTCLQTMQAAMNLTNGDMQDQMDKVRHDPFLFDILNILQSMVRSRIGEEVWYE